MTAGADARARAVAHVRSFLARALLFALVHAVVAAVVLVLAARIAVGTAGGDGAFATLGGWSFTALWALLGVVGGAALGVLTAAASGWTAFERRLGERLAHLPDVPGMKRIPVPELRARYRELLDVVVARTVGGLPVPAILVRLFRARLGQALVEEFLADCERRGVASVGIAECAGWLLLRGPAFLTRPVRVQLVVWRLVLVLLLLALAVVPLALGARTATPG